MKLSSCGKYHVSVTKNAAHKYATAAQKTNGESRIGDNRLPTEGVVTHRLPLAEFQKGLDMMHKGEGSIKIVLMP